MRLRTLLDGRGLVESPRWHGDALYFSDWSAGEVLRVGLDGRHEVVARVKSLPLCTAWLPSGQLVIVSSPDGLLLRLEPDGSLVTHADLGRPGWNDIVADGRGNVYVNGAGFDPATREFRPGGVTHVAPDGTVRQVADDIAFPNGNATVHDPQVDASPQVRDTKEPCRRGWRRQGSAHGGHGSKTTLSGTCSVFRR